MTEAEKALWQRLRDRQLKGFKFRRQQRIGPFVVDFVCLEKKLIVEVDGGQHSVERDQKRTAWLEAEGYRVVRFWNHEVLGNLEGVLERLVEVLGEK